MDPLEFQKNTEVDGCCFDHRQRYTVVVVPQSGGCLDFGRIPDDVAEATGLLPLPIRLPNGEHRWPENGFGARHILVTCSPKTDPGVMRVYRPGRGKETLDEAQEAQSRAGGAQAA